jgi:K+-sensing histidine kinase KdpD
VGGWERGFLAIGEPTQSVEHMKVRVARERVNRLLLKAIKPCHSMWTACFGALVATSVMFALNVLLGQFVRLWSPLLFFLPAVAISALVWGWLSGLKAALYSLFFGYYVSPYEQFSVHSVVEDTVLFLAAALYATVLREALLSAERNFERYRDSEEKLAFSQRSAGVGSGSQERRALLDGIISRGATPITRYTGYF